MRLSARGYKNGFIIYAGILAVIMPLMSLDHGTTWDEYAQHRYGQQILDFYQSFGSDKRALEYRNLHLYGGLFEIAAEGAVELFNPLFGRNYTYEIRHIVNALVGFLAMLFTGLLARYMGGWRCALIALIMISLSPRFLGHSMNNPKDIPFAAFFTMAIYFMLKVINAFPKPAKRHLAWLIVGIACTINIRAGGLLLICYFGLFLLCRIGYLCYKDGSFFSNAYLIKKGIFYGLIVVMLAYLGGVVFWPYGLMNPIVHPVKTLLTLSEFPAIIPVWFNGEKLMSSQLPWYYYPLSLSITTPLVLFVGLIVGFGYWVLKSLSRIRKDVAMVLFSLVFPIFYIIVSGSVVYDGIRQILFIYPLLVVLSSFGLSKLFSILKGRIARIAYWAGLTGFFLLPLTHIITNYPNEYVFYNTFVGGTNGAYGSYELDYWGNASKPLKKKLAKHIQAKVPPDSTVVILKNFVSPDNYLIERHHENVQWKNINGGVPGDRSYDYAILIARYFPLDYFENGKWPPKNILFQETVDGFPVAVVLNQPKHPN